MINFHFFLKERGITPRFWLLALLVFIGFWYNENLASRPFGQRLPLLFLDFEFPNSPAEKALLRKSQISISGGSGVGGGNAIRVDYIGIERGSERVVATIPLKIKSNEMSLCFDVLFPGGFKFVKGGKLHGLGPEKPVTGGKPKFAAGWSVRAGFRPKGGISTYIYDQEEKTKYGTTKSASTFVFKPGCYHSVSLHVKLNSTAGGNNGLVHLYVDGTPVVKSKKLKMRSSFETNSLIGTFLFSTFHGGSSIEYAPRTAEGNLTRENAYFDNIGVYDGKHVRLRPRSSNSGSKKQEKENTDHE